MGRKVAPWRRSCIGGLEQQLTSIRYLLTLTDVTVIATVGEAATLFARFPLEQRDKGHWTIAIRMLNNALKEPTNLKMATMSLSDCVILERHTSRPLPRPTIIECVSQITANRPRV